jgi:methyl-accepting chemotaxis protein
MKQTEELQSPYSALVLWFTRAISTLSIITIILLLCLSLSIFIGGGIIGQQLNNHNDNAQIRETTLSLLATSQEMRRREKDFVVRKDFVFSEKYFQLSNQAMQAVDKLKAMKQGEKYYKIISQLGESLQRHNQQFGLTLLIMQNLGLDKSKGLLGEIDNTSRAINKAMVDANYGPEIKNLFLTMNLLYLNSLTDGTQIDSQPMVQLANNAKTEISKLPGNKAANVQIINLIDQYVLEYNNILQQSKIYTTELAKLTTIFRDFEIGIDALVDITNAASRSSSDDLEVSIGNWELYVGWLSLLGILLVGIITVIILRKIIKNR